MHEVVHFNCGENLNYKLNCPQEWVQLNGDRNWNEKWKISLPKIKGSNENLSLNLNCAQEEGAFKLKWKFKHKMNMPAKKGCKNKSILWKNRVFVTPVHVGRIHFSRVTLLRLASRLQRLARRRSDTTSAQILKICIVYATFRLFVFWSFQLVLFVFSTFHHLVFSSFCHFVFLIYLSFRIFLLFVFLTFSSFPTLCFLSFWLFNFSTCFF